MKLKVGSRVFQPSWLSIALTVLLLPVFIKLGFWQLSRADEKQQLTQASQLGKQTVADYAANTALQFPRYQQVRITGHYDSAHQILLDNMPSNAPASAGQPGYRVWTPLLTDAGEVVLVDRGWVSLGASRTQLPDIAVSETPRSLLGQLDELPRPGTRAGNAGIQRDHWPQVLNYPLHEELQSLFAAPVAPRLLLLNADQPDGYERVWSMDVGFTPERHVAYAVQWFCFAVTFLIIFVVVNLKRIES